MDLCFGIEIGASRGAIVRENDSDRNSRTCLADRSARRDDSRRDLGRDRAKEAAKMNVGERHVQILTQSEPVLACWAAVPRCSRKWLAVPRLTGPNWPSFYAGSSPRRADCHPPRPAGALDHRPAQRLRRARRSGPSCKRSLAGRPRSRRPTVPHDFPIA